MRFIKSAWLEYTMRMEQPRSSEKIWNIDSYIEDQEENQGRDRLRIIEEDLRKEDKKMDCNTTRRVKHLKKCLMNFKMLYFTFEYTAHCVVIPYRKMLYNKNYNNNNNDNNINKTLH